jgi:PiT family inorganic phosphate transporter
MGVGASHRISAVRWGVATNIVMAWVLTLPAAAALSFAAMKMVALLVA